jgi:hypothetical protein
MYDQFDHRLQRRPIQRQRNVPLGTVQLSRKPLRCFNVLGLTRFAPARQWFICSPVK